MSAGSARRWGPARSRRSTADTGCASDQLDIDRQEFEDLVERARGYFATRTPERAIPLLTEALALWRGPAFGELEEWMPGRLEAVRLGQLRLAAEEDLLQARLDAGDHAGVAADGTVLTGQQPFRERRWALLALAQYRSGRQADALGLDPFGPPGARPGARPGPGLGAGRARVPDPRPGPRAGDRPRGADGRPVLPVEGTGAVRRPATATPSSGATPTSPPAWPGWRSPHCSL